MTDLRYPIGVFTPVDPSAAVRERAIDEIEALPERFAGAIKELNDAQLDTPYRPGGWTVRQVVHHVADSHINALIRMKLALTEEQPTVVGYDEKKFAELPDTRLPVDVSLQLLRSLHARWVALYRDMPNPAWARTFTHPEYPEALTLDWQLQMYAWHSRHHVAHIMTLRQREGW